MTMIRANRRHTVVSFLAAFALVATGIAVSGGSSSAATGSAAVSRAEKFLTKYENLDASIVLPPLTAKPPKNETVDFVGCPVSTCLYIQQGVQAAAKVLGWKVDVINGGLTAASFVSAMDQVSQNPADAVLGIGALPNSAMAPQLSALKAKGVPFIAVASPSPVGGDMIANFSPAAEIGMSGKVMAAWIIVNSKATANVAYFWDPTLTQELPAKSYFLQEMSSQCPACTVSVQDTNFTTGVGTTDPAQIVSYLEANPSTNYIDISVGDATAGVPQALAAAGLAGKVKIITRLGGTLNFNDIAAGTETMTDTEETSEIGWRMVDVAARHFLHDSITCCRAPVGTIHVITKADLPSNLNIPYAVPHYQTYFEKAWLLKK